MRRLSAADILRIWEVGRDQSPAERALTVLEHACPEAQRADLAALPLGARDRLLVETRAAALGTSLEATAACPTCGEEIEFALSCLELLSAQEAPEAPLEPSSPSQQGEGTAGKRLAVEGLDIRFRVLDSNDLLAIEGCANAESARRLLIERCVLEATKGEIEVAPSEISGPAASALAQQLVVSDRAAETLLDLVCPDCAARWQVDLDLPAFIWLELRARAAGLLDEVDTLARAYGWSEAEILALEPARRAVYMERAV